jgi:pyrimidine-specific ribonucleoside hydrolase
MARPIILDVDTGTDDALAILYAVAHPDLDVRGISCVAGNAGLEQVVTNTLKVLDAAGAPDLPVAAGARRPLIERTRPEGAFHGLDGLGGIPLPDSDRVPSPQSATELLRRLIMESDEPVTLVGLAPQTNLALLITQHPEVAEKLERIVFMGGAASGGNVTAVAEFNVWQDPEAATAVVEASIPTTMYGLDVFTRIVAEQSAADRLRGSSHPALRLAGELLYRRSSRADGSSADYLGQIGDAGAVVLVTDPDLFAIEEHPVRVNLAGIGRGQTIVDRRATAQDAAVMAADPWPRLDVVLDGQLTSAADRFVAVVESFAPIG